MISLNKLYRLLEHINSVEPDEWINAVANCPHDIQKLIEENKYTARHVMIIVGESGLVVQMSVLDALTALRWFEPRYKDKTVVADIDWLLEAAFRLIDGISSPDTVELERLIAIWDAN